MHVAYARILYISIIFIHITSRYTHGFELLIRRLVRVAARYLAARGRGARAPAAAVVGVAAAPGGPGLVERRRRLIRLLLRGHRR